MTKKSNSDLESEFQDKKKKHPSFFAQLIEFIRPTTRTIKKKAPMSFNIVLSAALFLIYISIFIGTHTALTFLFIVPVLYILARHIKLEREISSIEEKES